MNMAEYQVFRIPLDTAGTFAIDRAFGYFHVVEFQDATGEAVLDGKIELSLSVSEDDFIPLRYNNKVARATDRGRVRWAAQSGIVAIVLVANDATRFAADTPNPRQLVTSSVGTVLEAEAITVGTTEVELSPADTTRQSVTIQNLGSADVYIGPTGVTTSSGIKLASNGSLTLDKQTAAVYGISGSAGQDVRVARELS